MTQLNVPAPLIAFVAATRAALGAGLGLLASKKLSRDTRRRVGISLVALGALTTIPAALLLIRARRRALEGGSIAAA